MARKKKEQKEKYIKTRVSPITGLTTYQVFIEPSARSADERYTTSFAERDYGSKEEALKAAIRDRNRVLDRIDLTGTITVNKKITLTEVFEEMIEICNYSNSTKKTYKNTFKQVFKNEIGGVDLDKLSAKRINQCVRNYIDRGQERIDSIENIITQTLIYAKKQMYIEINPMDQYTKVKSTKIVKPKDQSIDPEDYQKLVSYLSRPSKTERIDFNRKLILAILECINALGIRPSEALALKKSDFDFIKKTVSITEALDYSESDNIRMKNTKSTSGIRIIPMSKEFESAMRDWFAIQPSEIVFAKFDGTFYNPRYLSSWITEICDRLGFHFNIYMLRHKFATELVVNQTDPRTFQELMGHSSPAMTIFYARSNDELKQKAVEKISKLS